MRPQLLLLIKSVTGPLFLPHPVSVTSDVSDVVDKVMPSIVSITSMSVQEVQSFFGGTYEQTSEGAGTGIIIGKNDTELLIVTKSCCRRQ